jgi:hypothetical protein
MTRLDDEARAYQADLLDWLQAITRYRFLLERVDQAVIDFGITVWRR